MLNVTNLAKIIVTDFALLLPLCYWYMNTNPHSLLRTHTQSILECFYTSTVKSQIFRHILVLEMKTTYMCDTTVYRNVFYSSFVY